MKKITFFLVILFAFSFSCTIAKAGYFEHEAAKTEGNAPLSLYGRYKLNTFILEQYNIISYGEPFGNWMPSITGLMTHKATGERGEYQYLGYSFSEQIHIPNDKYLNTLEKSS